eukprot:892745_1
MEIKWEKVLISDHVKNGLPLPRNCHGVCARGSKVFTFGGIAKKCMNEVRMLDLESRSSGWSLLADSSQKHAPPARQNSAVVMVGREMFVFGGSNKGFLFNDMYAFDTEKHIWREIPTRGDLPPARDRHAMVFVRGALYVFGGHSTEVEYAHDMYALDVRASKWRLVRPCSRAPTPRYGHSLVATEDSLILFGGKYASGCFKDIHVFDLATSTWHTPEVRGIFPAARWGQDAVIYKNCVVVFGGWNGTWCFNDIHILDLSTMHWRACSLSLSAPCPRAFHACALAANVRAHFLVVFGGRDRKARMCDAFRLNLDGILAGNNSLDINASSGDDMDDSKIPPARPPAPSPEGIRTVDGISDRLAAFSLKIERTASTTHSYAQMGECSRKWHISDFDLLETLGTGTFGRVRFCRYKHSGSYYAIKMLKKTEILRLKQEEHILSEKAILSSIKHPFIVDMVGCFQNQKYLFFVLDYIPGGEFFTHLRRAQRLKLRPTVFYAAQIVLIFQYLHSKGIVYRDLKPENLLLDKSGNIRLTDFGFAKRVDTRTWTLCGTPEYIAPEILLNKGHGRAVDWWALGILIYEMLCGHPPFLADDPMQIYQQILSGKVNFPSHMDGFSRDLISQLLQADITKRLGNLQNGVEDVKKHPFFTSIKWDACYNKELPAPFRPEYFGLTDTHNFEHYPESGDEEPGLGLYGECGHFEGF